MIFRGEGILLSPEIIRRELPRRVYLNKEMGADYAENI